MLTRVKTQDEIRLMRESGKILAKVLESVKENVSTGVSTKFLADVAAKELKILGGKPAFLGYQGFPDVLCVSINDEVVHGIPKKDRFLEDGDLVSLDFGVNYMGMITDAAISLINGKPKDESYSNLVLVTEQSLMAGINVLHDGVRTGDIGETVEAVLNKHRYGIVRDLVGHGVGHYLHEDPNVPNYGNKGTGYKFSKNMTIAIEPMATMGDYHVYIANDGWTVLTEDGSWAAHFEHSVLITENGSEILTKN